MPKSANPFWNSTAGGGWGQQQQQQQQQQQVVVVSSSQQLVVVDQAYLFQSPSNYKENYKEIADFSHNFLRGLLMKSQHQGTITHPHVHFLRRRISTNYYNYFDDDYISNIVYSAIKYLNADPSSTCHAVPMEERNQLLPLKIALLLALLTLLLSSQ